MGWEDFLSKAVEYELCKLFLKEMKMHQRVEKLKQEITLMYDYSHEDAFSSIDDFNYGYVDFSNLKWFLKKNGYIPTNKDLAAIIRWLDLNADSKLGKNEFIEGIKPVEPYSKVDIKGAFKEVVASKIKKVMKKRWKTESEVWHFSKSLTRGRATNPYDESPMRWT